MINTTIDLGQLIIAVLTGVVGFFVKRELSNFTEQLARHDAILDGLLKDVNQLIGFIGLRKEDRNRQ